MKPIAKTQPSPSWEKLSKARQDLMTRLCLPNCDGIHVLKLTVEERRDADHLLAQKLVEYRELVLRIRPEGLRFFVQESGLFQRRVG